MEYYKTVEEEEIDEIKSSLAATDSFLQDLESNSGTSRNDVVEKLNVTIQKQLPGQKYDYKSIDWILNDDEAVQYPIEFHPDS
ncbi:hypothetical protein TNCT_158491 [Trichonephila clavata]|uniref:Uncharacterized protein n=1 Tax=Trichonephila clavata TaxID=2740835 RepID=A0A8X6IV89_TRICU|nr:hypothetical protein TNCT_158491 [Trichonephila clavata]